MRRRLLAAYADHFRRTWPRRLCELVGAAGRGDAWSDGYGADRRGLRSRAFEGLVRTAELTGVGLAYSTLEVLLAGGRYRALTDRERAFARPEFSDAELERAVVDEGARLVAGTLGIAYVAGFAVKAPRAIGPTLLCHELTHTRQFARWGWAYVAKCLAAQWWGGGYGYTPQTRRGLNAEQEAAAVEDRARVRSGLPERHAR